MSSIFDIMEVGKKSYFAKVKQRMIFEVEGSLACEDEWTEGARL